MDADVNCRLPTWEWRSGTAQILTTTIYPGAPCRGTTLLGYPGETAGMSAVPLLVSHPPWTQHWRRRQLPVSPAKVNAEARILPQIAQCTGSYPTMHQSEQKYAHFCCAVGYGTGALGVCEIGLLTERVHVAYIWQHIVKAPFVSYLHKFCNQPGMYTCSLSVYILLYNTRFIGSSVDNNIFSLPSSLPIAFTQIWGKETYSCWPLVSDI